MIKKKFNNTSRKLFIISLAIFLITTQVANATREKLVGYPLPPDGKIYYGIQLDASNDSIESYSSRFGSTPALIGLYVNFPLFQSDTIQLENTIDQLAVKHSSLMLTLEPRKDLSAVTPNLLKDLSDKLIRWNRKGVPVIVRFAHEMNGSWYPWGQNPEEYKKVFRNVATAVHKSPDSSILWSPNDGGGYPFTGGPYSAKPGSNAYKTLDTNQDGILNMSDDSYAPYWPGANSVDWVGLSIYHFGAAYPWGENEIPGINKLAAKLNGTYRNEIVDETAVPDFYEIYSVNYKKPFAISETAAFYNSSINKGASEKEIKSAWIKQLFDSKFLDTHSNIKLMTWFEFKKQENDSGNAIIDWRINSNSDLSNEFKTAMKNRFEMAPIK